MLSLIIDPEGSDVLSTFIGKPEKNVTLADPSPEPNKQNVKCYGIIYQHHDNDDKYWLKLKSLYDTL